MTMMTNRMRRLLACAIGCCMAMQIASSHAQGDSARSYDNALSARSKVIGVAVLSGYRADVVTLGGLMGFGYANRLVTRNDGLISDRLYETLKTELDREERYEVKRLAVEPAQARQFVNEIWDRRSSRFGKLSAELQALTAGCQCDAVLLLADGPNHNTMAEAGLSHGPAWAGTAGALGGKTATKAHMRVGWYAMLIAPETGKRVASALVEERPDYAPASAENWPGQEGEVSEQLWQRMADYLGRREPLLRKALYEVGLRPSCALPFFETGGQYSSRSQFPPSTLPGSDPQRCQ